MPREPKPYLHRGWWVTNIGGSRHKLCREEEGRAAASDALLDLRQQQRRLGGRTFPNLNVAELIALFLDTLKLECSASNYENHCRWLTEFCKLHGHRLAKSLTPLDGQNFKNGFSQRTWKTKHTGPHPYSPKTVNHALAALKQCWNWAITTELLPHNPFSKIPMIFCDNARQRIMTDSEFQSLLRHTDACFRQFLLTLRFTSSRPGELRKLTWSMIDWKSHCFIIRKHKTIKTMREPKPRIIPFPPCIEALLLWRKRTFGDQTPAVFLNKASRPWTKEGVTIRMRALRERAGIGPDENGEELVLYTHRHTYITTAAIEDGMAGPMLQKLAGHTNIKMTERYVHLANKPLYEASLGVANALRPARAVAASATAAATAIAAAAVATVTAARAAATPTDNPCPPATS